MFTSSK